MRGRKSLGDKLTVRITLSCGHSVKSRHRPINEDVKFGCTAGLGCGYFLNWVSWSEGDQTWNNRKEFTK